MTFLCVKLWKMQKQKKQGDKTLGGMAQFGFELHIPQVPSVYLIHYAHAVLLS